MQSSPTQRVLALGLLATAAVHTIMVGQGGLKYSPDSITAAAGDQVEFHWASAGHSVTQGDEDNACQPLSADSFYSGIESTAVTLLYIVIRAA